MAEIDPDLAMQWSAEKGHRYDDDVRFAEARKLAETDADDALALLNQKPDSASQTALQELADRFAETDPKKALRFADEAAVQARGLNQPDRALAMARAGAVLVKLGRGDVGRKLIDEAARDAAQLPVVNRDGYYRGLVAGIVAPYDVDRALALVEPIKTENQEGHRNRARIAAAIATTHTKRAVELVETVGGTAFYHEMARTAIAYQIGRDRPDEAIKIIEDMKREPATIWQAEAFGWLAVALAPRDRARANALIDRALAMMIDERDSAGRSAWSGGEMAGAAHVALCARRIGYPDMESVVMRVIAARPTERPQRVHRADQPGSRHRGLDRLPGPGRPRGGPDGARTVGITGWVRPDRRVEHPRAVADRLGAGRPPEGQGRFRVHSGVARSTEGSQPLEHRLLRNGRTVDGPARSPRGDSRPTRRRGILAAGRGALECLTIGSCPCEITPPGPPFVRA